MATWLHIKFSAAMQKIARKERREGIGVEVGDRLEGEE